MNILLCDDNLLHLDYALSTAKTALKGLDVQFHCYHCAEDIMALLSNITFIPHIAILDIEINDSSGIQLAKQITDRFPQCQIIFLSAYPLYAPEVYQTTHVWFVLKNRMEEFLPQALKKAVAALGNGGQALSITVKQKRTYQKVAVDQIYLIERIAHQTRIYTVNGSVLVRQSPDELLQGLPGNCFIRCHQSYWVNASKISAYVSNEFHLLDGSVIPVSRTFKKAALAALNVTAS